MATRGVGAEVVNDYSELKDVLLKKKAKSGNNLDSRVMLIDPHKIRIAIIKA